MPEINFYINDDERIELFDYLIDNRAIIVPNRVYPSDVYQPVNDRYEFLEIAAKETVRFFVLSPDFSIYGLYLDLNEYLKPPAYMVAQRYGGPYIDLALYRGFADDAPVKIKGTNLSYYPRFIKLQEQYEELKATDELKKFYDNMVKFLKSKCRKEKIGNKTYWVRKG